MCSKLHKYFYAKIWKKLYVFRPPDIFKFLLPIYPWYLCTLEWKQNIIIRFYHKINSRHPTIKFDFKYPKSITELLDTKIYKNKEESKLLTTTYRKQTDQRNFWNPTSAHPKSLINSIPFSEALQLKKICSETSELNKYLNELKELYWLI